MTLIDQEYTDDMPGISPEVVVGSLTDLRESEIDDSIEIFESIPGIVATDETSKTEPTETVETEPVKYTETDTSPDVINGEAFVTLGNMITLKHNSYEGHQKGIEVARDNVVLAFKLKEKEAAEERELREAA